MKKFLEWAVKIIVFLIFFVPLIVIPSSFIFPFIVPKILTFRSLVEFALAGYILLLFINFEEYRPRITPLNLSFGAFILSFALSTLFGVDAYHSFWDNHERMLGLFTILHYAAFYFICGGVLKNWKEWRLAMKIFLIAGGIVMALGLMQIGHPEFLMNQGGDRVSSTLGNPIYVGGYGLFLLFMAALLFAKEKSGWCWWRPAEIILAGLAVSGMIYSGSRGAIIGLIVGMFVTVIGYAIILKDQASVRKYLRALIVLMFVGSVILFTNRQNPSIQKIPAVGRLLGTSWSYIVTGPRMIAWKIAFESWKERPILGWGPNNFFYAFNKYYNPVSLEFGFGETWFDNAHNIIMNTLTVQGAFGLLMYLSIFGVAVISLWQEKELRTQNPHLVVLAAAFLLAHLAQNITVFENPTSYLYFVFWLALINRLVENKKISVAVLEKSDDGKAGGADKPGVPDRVLYPGLLWATFAVTIFAIYAFNYRPAVANQSSLRVLQIMNSYPTNSAKVIEGLFAFKSPHIDDIRADVGRSFLSIAADYQKIGKDKVDELMKIIYPALQENITLHPMDIRNQLAIAQLGQVWGMMNNDPKRFWESEQYLRQALQYSPKRQQVLYMLANLLAQTNRRDEAVTLTKQAIDLDPKIGESYWRLAYLYYVFGNYKEAAEVYKTARDKGVGFDSQGQEVEQMVLKALAGPAVKK